MMAVVQVVHKINVQDMISFKDVLITNSQVKRCDIETIFVMYIGCPKKMFHKSEEKMHQK